MEENEKYSVAEVEELIEKLVNDEAMTTKICKAYAILGCEQRAGMSPEDLIAQVQVDTFDGTRSWKRNITIERHFFENGRSIIDNIGKKYSRHIFADDPHNVCDLKKPDIETRNCSHHLPDEHLHLYQSQGIWEEWSQKILELFSEDSAALCYLKQHLIDNTGKKAIMEACNLTQQIYGNTRKRIKDKVKKRFPGGIKWWEIQ